MSAENDQWRDIKEAVMTDEGTEIPEDVTIGEVGELVVDDEPGPEDEPTPEDAE